MKKNKKSKQAHKSKKIDTKLLANLDRAFIAVGVTTLLLNIISPTIVLINTANLSSTIGAGGSARGAMELMNIFPVAALLIWFAVGFMAFAKRKLMMATIFATLAGVANGLFYTIVSAAGIVTSVGHAAVQTALALVLAGVCAFILRRDPTNNLPFARSITGIIVGMVAIDVVGSIVRTDDKASYLTSVGLTLLVIAAVTALVWIALRIAKVTSAVSGSILIVTLASLFGSAMLYFASVTRLIDADYTTVLLLISAGVAILLLLSPLFAHGYRGKRL